MGDFPQIATSLDIRCFETWESAQKVGQDFIVLNVIGDGVEGAPFQITLKMQAQSATKAHVKIFKLLGATSFPNPKQHFFTRSDLCFNI